MTQEVVLMFLPVTMPWLRENSPAIFETAFPDWVAHRCPMPSMDLTLPWAPSVTMFWPVTSLIILGGLVMNWVMGARLLTRALRESTRARQGLFIWSLAFLAYGFMCIGGLFFHGFHVKPIFQLLDAIATGLSSMSIIAGFAAFSGLLDDRKPTQRIAVLILYLILAVAAIFGPPLLFEQLYIVPSFVATGVGLHFSLKCGAKGHRASTPAAQQAGCKAALSWLCVGAVGVVIALGTVFLDKLECLYLGANFSLLFWFFLGCNLSMWSVYRFVLTVCKENLQFTNVKRQ